MKHVKRIASLVLALVMVLALSAGVFAAAVNEGRITIDNAITGQTYTIYEILHLESYNKESNAYSYKATAAWKDFVESKDIKDTYLVTNDQGYVTWVENADAAAFAVHRNAGEIADVLIASGELIEKRRFAAVLVSGKSESHASSTSTLAASSSRSESVYPRRNTSTGSPIGAMRVTVMCVLGMTPISSSRSRRAPSPPTLRMIPDCPTCSLSNVISFSPTFYCILYFTALSSKINIQSAGFIPPYTFTENVY